MRLPRVRLRTLMIAVAVAGAVMAIGTEMLDVGLATGDTAHRLFILGTLCPAIFLAMLLSTAVLSLLERAMRRDDGKPEGHGH